MCTAFKPKNIQNFRILCTVSSSRVNKSKTKKKKNLYVSPEEQFPLVAVSFQIYTDSSSTTNSPLPHNTKQLTGGARLMLRNPEAINFHLPKVNEL